MLTELLRYIEKEIHIDIEYFSVRHIASIFHIT
jgi:hypothetical protein